MSANANCRGILSPAAEDLHLHWPPKVSRTPPPRQLVDADGIRLPQGERWQVTDAPRLVSPGWHKFVVSSFLRDAYGSAIECHNTSSADWLRPLVDLAMNGGQRR